MCACVCLCRVAQFSLTLGTPGTIACQALLSVGLPRQEYWSGLPFPFPRDLPQPRIEPHLWRPLRWQADSLPLYHLGSQACLWPMEINLTSLIAIKECTPIIINADSFPEGGRMGKNWTVSGGGGVRAPWKGGSCYSGSLWYSLRKCGSLIQDNQLIKVILKSKPGECDKSPALIN